MKSLRTPALFLSLLIVALALAGCGKKTDQAAGGAASDSLLSASPVEQPQGQIPPKDSVAAPAAAPTGTPEPAPAPASSGTPAHQPKRSPAPQGHPSSHASAPAAAPEATVPAGTSLAITIGTALNTETAKAGDAWSGTIKEAVTVGSAAPFPAGSTVSGVVEGVNPAAKGDRAFIVLRVTSISSNGRTHEISASADTLVAGSTRKRNVGAIAGGAAAGALIGKALGGSSKGAVIGGILGGAAATGVVAGSKGFQVDVPQGKEMVFKVDHDTRVKL